MMRMPLAVSVTERLLSAPSSSAYRTFPMRRVIGIWLCGFSLEPMEMSARPRSSARTRSRKNRGSHVPSASRKLPDHLWPRRTGLQRGAIAFVDGVGRSA